MRSVGRRRRSLREVAVLAALVGPSAGCLEAPPGAKGIDASNPPALDGGSDASAACAPAATGGRLGGSYQTFCAVTSESRLFCWGEGTAGQIGNGAMEDQPLAQAVQSGEGDLVDVLAVAAGVDFTCALLGSGEVTCWGANAVGQLGNSDPAQNAAGNLVQGIDDAVAITADGTHACALRGGGQVSCWGRNAAGELGDDSFENSSTPVSVVLEGGDLLAGAVAIDAGRYHTCVADAAGSVACFGWNKAGQVYRTVDTESCSTAVATVVRDEEGAPLEGLSMVAAGTYHSCAASCRDVRCWGHPRCGQLGNGGSDACTPIDGTCADQGWSPAVVVALDQVQGCEPAQLVLGVTSSCARCGDGRVVCWGNGSRGRLGTGDEESSAVPVEVQGLDDAVDLAVGLGSACALREQEDRVVCWGVGDAGELGDGSLEEHAALEPQPVTGLPP